MNATTFKAQCLALLEDVARTGEEILVLKRGRPVARVCPATYIHDTYPQDALAGSVEIIGDVIEPVLPPEVWDAEHR